MRKQYLVLFLTAMIAIHLISQISFAADGKDFWGRIFIASLAKTTGETAEQDWVFRKNILLNYRTSVNAKNEVALSEFRGGDNAASRSIGQGKTTLVLRMLKQVAGAQAFSRISKKITNEASGGAWDWNDLRVLSEKEIGQDLGWFFKQWVDRKGLPDLRVENAAVRRNGSRFEVSFDLVQTGDVYTIDVPVFISSLQGRDRTELVKIDGQKTHASFLVDDEPSMLTVDRDYEVPRRLTEDETPPLLAKILNEDKPILVPPVSGVEVYAGLIEACRKRGSELRNAGDIKDADVKTSSFIALGKDNPIVNRLYGKVESQEGELGLRAMKNPWSPGKVVVILQARTAGRADDALHSLEEYGDFTFLAIDQKGVISRKTADSQRGLEIELREPAKAVDLSTLKTLTNVIERVSEKKIVYVGEYHDRFAHHNVQIQVIRGLANKNAKLAVGMEMFQRPFQNTLDDYINGVIEEPEFIKRSEYFKRWGFEYSLYKPILDFARAGKIPVVALNVRREIIDKVSKSGLDQLSGEELKEIPQQLDFSDDEYRARLMDVFSQHEARQGKNFDFFYQAQILWDETMSLSIEEFLKSNPDYRMVVIAGAGHIAYGSGIPKRTFRRNGLSYATILSDVGIEQEVADYVVFPQPLDGALAPKLMAMLKEANGMVSIAGFAKDSASQRAGLRVDDAIIALDNIPVRSVEDIKLALQYKNREEALHVTVRRHRFLLGDKELALDVKLQ